MHASFGLEGLVSKPDIARVNGSGDAQNIGARRLVSVFRNN